MSCFNLPIPRAHFIASAFNAKGELIWEDECDNLVTTVGKNSVGDVYLRAQTQITAWYCGLKAAGTPSAADTMSSHGAWTEVYSQYSQATRPALTLAAFSAGASSNTASVAVFSFTSSVTVAGAFVCSNNTKNGTTGVLLNVANFTTSKDMASGDSINLTVNYAL